MFERLTQWQSSGGAGLGLYAGAVGAIGLVIVGAVGLGLHQPWLFPSLGPTVMVLAETPGERPARPHAVVAAHLVGVLAGVGCLAAAGLRHSPPVTETGLTWQHVAAAAASIAITTFVLQLLRIPHAPAGATTLIVSLGILHTSRDLLVIMLSVVLLTAVASAINRAVGIRQAGMSVGSGRGGAEPRSR